MKISTPFRIYSIGCLSLLSANCSVNDSDKNSQALTDKPNIVIIFADDLGYGDIGVFGATGYNTPHLDKMASEGMLFNDFLVSSAVCTASRAGLMTGCYNVRLGLTGALMPFDTIGINPEEETLAELLKEVDYKTIAIGKWHLGHHPEFLPVNHGFDEYLGIPYSNDMWPLDYNNVRATPKTNARKAAFPELPLIHNQEIIKEFLNIEDQDEITTLYTEKAVGFIKQNRDQPFFLYLAHSMPHVPLAVSDKFRGKSEQGLYGDVIMEIDWSVGEIIKTLDEYGLTENTLVIFTSDNGPWINFGNHAGSTGGLREGKSTTWEGGQRVPCIMKWPAVIPAGTVCSKLASTIDILPTLSAISGAPLPKKKFDGVNILPLLKDDKYATPREVFYYFTRTNLEAVRWKNWKYVFPHTGRSYEGFEPGKDGLAGEINSRFPFEAGLYDLQRDPGERYNVLQYHPEIVEKMKMIADEARNDLGDNLQKISGLNTREPGRITP
jgi:arylsulfatase A-like enzyme